MPRLLLLLRQARALAVHVTRRAEACETAVIVQTNGPAQICKRMLGASFASSAEPPDDSKPPPSPALSESEEDAEVLDEVAERQRWRQFAERALDNTARATEPESASQGVEAAAREGPSVEEISADREGHTELEKISAAAGGQESAPGVHVHPAKDADSADALQEVGAATPADLAEGADSADMLLEAGAGTPDGYAEGVDHGDTLKAGSTEVADELDSPVVEEVKDPAAEVLPAAGDGTLSDAPRAASDQIDWTSWLKQRMSSVNVGDTTGASSSGPATSASRPVGLGQLGGAQQTDFLSRYGMGAARAAGEGAIAGQLGRPATPAKPSVRAAPVVVGMQAPEGWDQTYGELSRGPFTPEVDTSTRIHPTHTFLPGHMYAPEDLVTPGAGASRGGPAYSAQITEKMKNGQVLREVDWRSIEVLNVFLSPAGRLPARRKSKLKQCVHRHMCRQIKVARQMALIPYQHRLREYDEEEMAALTGRDA